ncbi:MAG: hypothetical protein IPN30_03530 [Flavobacteriales bacterium]|nr:hypothetical protein [Flavobacteriales bacterium]
MTYPTGTSLMYAECGPERNPEEVAAENASSVLMVKDLAVKGAPKVHSPTRSDHGVGSRSVGIAHPAYPGHDPPTQCGDDGQETRMDAGYICLLTLPRMPQNRSYSVLHPTDLPPISLPAFAHGLLLATKAKGRFTVLHVDGDEEMHWNEMPGVRTMLAKWGNDQWC